MPFWTDKIYILKRLKWSNCSPNTVTVFLSSTQLFSKHGHCVSVFNPTVLQTRSLCFCLQPNCSPNTVTVFLSSTQQFSKHSHCVSVLNPTVLQTLSLCFCLQPNCSPLSPCFCLQHNYFPSSLCFGLQLVLLSSACVSVFNPTFSTVTVSVSSTQLSPNNVIVFPSLTQLSSPSLSPAQLFSKQCHCVSVFNPTVLHVTVFLSSTKLSISQCISIFKDCILLPSTFILKFWQLTNTAMRT